MWNLAGRTTEYVPLNWPITARQLNWVLCYNKAGYSPMLYDFLGFITDGFSGFFSSLPWEKEKENIAITYQFANLMLLLSEISRRPSARTWWLLYSTETLLQLNKLNNFSWWFVLPQLKPDKIKLKLFHIGLMVSELDSGSSGPGSSPGRGHCVVFLGKRLQGVTLRWTGIPSRME